MQRILLATLAVACTARQPWMNAALPISQRVASLMAAMTVEEKIAQLQHTKLSTLSPGDVPPALMNTSFGAVTIESVAPINASTCNVSCRIAQLRTLQSSIITTSRLHIPVSLVIETSHCGAAGGTIFGMGAMQGSSWNASLVTAIAAAIASEGAAWGGDRGLSPEINVWTDPRGGRAEENFGEDPLHVAVMADAAVTGLQGGNAMPGEYLPSTPPALVAEAKHCCAYGAGGMDGAPADLSPATLHNVYLRPWKAYMAAGGRGMMLAHNEVNGVQMHMNGDIMADLFRGAYNYTGFFASDYGNIDALSNTRVCGNLTACAALAITAGCDQSMNGDAYTQDVMLPAITSGLINMTYVDRAVASTLTSKFAAGLFDGRLPDPAARPAIYSDANRALAREAVHQSAVLLANNGILPLDVSKLTRVAVIGPNSGCVPAGPPTPPPPGQCQLQNTTDCDGNDFQKLYNVTDPGVCCTACLNNSNCYMAVLAVSAQQCLLKTACTQPTYLPDRIALWPSGKPAVPDTPWSCTAMRSMLGGYSNLERSTDVDLDNHANVTTLTAAIVAAANASGNAFSVDWAMGAQIGGSDTSGFSDAVAAATGASVAILALGDSAEGVGYDASASCGEGADRPSLDLPGVQLDLLAAVLNTGTPVIVVLIHGRPVTFGSDWGGAFSSRFTVNGSTPLNARAAAVLSAWRPGSEAGAPLWDLLTGVVSPSGRLAQAWPVHSGGVHEGGISPWFRKFCSEECGGYTLDTPFAPLFPFGYGLDYLSVTYGASSVVVDSAAQTVNVSVTVLNAAARAGAKVVQIYFTQELSTYVRYRQMLAGFAKVMLPASSSTQVTIAIPWYHLAYYDQRATVDVTEAAPYTFLVCHDSMSCPGSNQATVTIPTTTTYPGLQRVGVHTAIAQSEKLQLA